MFPSFVYAGIKALTWEQASCGQMCTYAAASGCMQMCTPAAAPGIGHVHLCGSRGCRQMCTFIITPGFRQMCISAAVPVWGQMCASVSTRSGDRCTSLQLQWVSDRCAPLHRPASLDHQEYELKIIWRKAKIIRNLSHLTGEKEFKALAVLLKGMLCRYQFFGSSLMTWKKETKKIMNIPRMESVQELPIVQKSD